MRGYLPELGTAIRLTVILMVLTGILYPLAVTGIAQGLFYHRANGSLVRVNGQVAGSSLIGQEFTSSRYFHGRPSDTINAAGTPQPYDASASGASNLGPTNPALIRAVEQQAAAIRCQNGLKPGPGLQPVKLPAAAKSASCAPIQAKSSAVPVDAVTSSGSGLDPDISIAYADLQVARVAKARHLPETQVQALVNQHILGRQFQVLGEPRVNVLDLNTALDRLSSG